MRRQQQVNQERPFAQVMQVLEPVGRFLRGSGDTRESINGYLTPSDDYLHDLYIYINNPGARGSAAKFFFAKAEKRL